MLCIVLGGWCLSITLNHQPGFLSRTTMLKNGVLTTEMLRALKARQEFMPRLLALQDYVI